MRTTGKTFQRACDVLRSRVRFETAHLRLPTSQLLSDNDTETIRKATRLYVESWIVPLINAMQNGKVRDLKELL